MTVKELKDFLNKMEDDNEVCICVNEPAGWMCPDGAVVDVKRVVCGFDWHQNQVLLVPENELDIHNIEEWGKIVKGPDEPGNPLKIIRTLKKPSQKAKETIDKCKKSEGGLQTFK